MFEADLNLLEARRYSEKNQLGPEEDTAATSAIIKLQQIQNNTIGVIELSAQLDIAQVTDIFIRINSKGTALSQADFAMSRIASDERYNGTVIRKTVDYFCHLLARPEDCEAICSMDRDFAASEDFARIRWATAEHADIYEPDCADVLRVPSSFSSAGADSPIWSVCSRDATSRPANFPTTLPSAPLPCWERASMPVSARQTSSAT